MDTSLTLEKLGWDFTPIICKDNKCEFTITQTPIPHGDYYVLYYLINTNRPKAGIKKADKNILQVEVGNKILKENNFMFSNIILEEFRISDTSTERFILESQIARKSLFYDDYEYYFNGFIGKDVVFEIKHKECHYDSIDKLSLIPGEKTMGILLDTHKLICPVMKYDFVKPQIWFKGQIFRNIDERLVVYQDNDYKIYVREIDNRLMLERTTYTGLVESFMIYPHILQKGDTLNVCLQEYDTSIKVFVNGRIVEINNLMPLADKYTFINKKDVSYSNIKTHIDYKKYTSECDRCLVNDYKVSFDKSEVETEPLDIAVYINRNYWVKVIEQHVVFVNSERRIIREKKYAI